MYGIRDTIDEHKYWGNICECWVSYNYWMTNNLLCRATGGATVIQIFFIILWLKSPFSSLGEIDSRVSIYIFSWLGIMCGHLLCLRYMFDRMCQTSWIFLSSNFLLNGLKQAMPLKIRNHIITSFCYYLSYLHLKARQHTL